MQVKTLSSDMRPESRTNRTSSCSFCGKQLGKEYFFTCHVCGATYCYIHMYRHARAHRLQTPLVTK